ncbi:MAG: SPOR domain-containing protein [Phycisphaerae bacterium]
MRQRAWCLAVWPLLAACAAGCPQQMSPDQQRLLSDAQSSYDSGDDAATVRAMDQFLAANPRGNGADQAYCLRGMARFRMRNIDGARVDLQQALDRTDSPQVKGRAIKVLGDLAFEEGNLPTAESMYRQALGFMDENVKPADEVRYRLGQILQRTGRWADADVQFGRLMFKFPNTDLARRAERMIHCTAWTVQVAAMKSRDSAAAKVDGLKKMNLPAAIQNILTDSGPLFAVQVGRYSTYEQALAALPTVKAVSEDAFITPTK